MLPNYFAKLETDDRAGKKSTRIGVSQLDAALRTSHAGSLATVFAKFSLGLYRRGLPLGSALTSTPRRGYTRPARSVSLDALHPGSRARSCSRRGRRFHSARPGAERGDDRGRPEGTPRSATPPSGSGSSSW